jgi:hypothetical protein
MWQRTVFILACAFAICGFAYAGTGPADLQPKVVFPNGGEVITAGEPMTIQWMAPKVEPINTRILLSTNGGKSYDITLADLPGEPNAPTRMRTWVWENPQPVGSENRIMISLGYVMLVVVNDESDGNFTLAPKYSVKMISPMGGDKYERGNPVKVSWTNAGFVPDAVEIRLSEDGGKTFPTVLTKVTDAGELGVWAWDTQHFVGDKFALQINAEKSGRVYSAMTEGTFSIYGINVADEPKMVTVTNPEAGASYNVGDEIPVKWQQSVAGATTMDIMISTDGGKTFSTSVGHIDRPDATGKWIWKNDRYSGRDVVLMLAVHNEKEKFEGMSGSFGISSTSSGMVASNYPNPFNPTTTISFTLPETAPVKLTVFDITGREVAIPVNGTLEAGEHHVQFNAADLPSGTYLYRIDAGNLRVVNKMMLTR